MMFDMSALHERALRQLELWCDHHESRKQFTPLLPKSSHSASLATISVLQPTPLKVFTWVLESYLLQTSPTRSPSALLISLSRQIAS